MPSSSAVFCESDNFNSWKTGVARALKKYLPESLQNEDVTEE